MGSVSDFLSEVDFGDLFRDLEFYGWFHIVFPLMLVYAVVFTILNNVEVFRDRKPVKVIIALIFGLFAVAFPISDADSCGIHNSSYRIADGCTLGDLMISLFPGVTAFSIGILALYIVAGMLGVDLTKFFGRGEDSNKFIMWVLGALGVFVVLYYYALGFGWGGFESTDNWLWGDDGLLQDPLLYILLLFGLFFWWVTKDDDEDGRARRNRRGDDDRGVHIHNHDN